ncbi:MAG: hypothetical protein F6K47_04700 [Symploca sp. SIO2E6]|nr:hypothetical protein [Symploca sp. SIO2E6]
MSQSPITVTYSLEEILKQINHKLDKIDEKFETKLDTFQKETKAELDKIDEKFETKFDTFQKETKAEFDKFGDKLDKIDERLGNLEKSQTKVETRLDSIEIDVKELKGSSKAQIWTLIGILITAVGGFLVAVGRFVITPKL